MSVKELLQRGLISKVLYTPFDISDYYFHCLRIHYDTYKINRYINDCQKDYPFKIDITRVFDLIFEMLPDRNSTEKYTITDMYNTNKYKEMVQEYNNIMLKEFDNKVFFLRVSSDLSTLSSLLPIFVLRYSALKNLTPKCIIFIEDYSSNLNVDVKLIHNIMKGLNYEIVRQTDLYDYIDLKYLLNMDITLKYNTIHTRSSDYYIKGNIDYRTKNYYPTVFDHIYHSIKNYDYQILRDKYDCRVECISYYISEAFIDSIKYNGCKLGLSIPYLYFIYKGDYIYIENIMNIPISSTMAEDINNIDDLDIWKLFILCTDMSDDDVNNIKLEISNIINDYEVEENNNKSFTSMSNDHPIRKLLNDHPIRKLLLDKIMSILYGDST